MKTLNVAVIGVGRMGTNHARVLSEMPGVTLKAVCDANRELAEKASKRFLAERACVDADAVLEIRDLDAAIIAVPTAEHVAVARNAWSAAFTSSWRSPWLRRWGNATKSSPIPAAAGGS